MSLDHAPTTQAHQGNVVVATPEIDDYHALATCPSCHREARVATPRLPVTVLADDELVLDLTATGVEHVPTYGWQCDRHRRTIVLPAPPEHAPESYRRVNARIHDRVRSIAVPDTILMTATKQSNHPEQYRLPAEASDD